MSHVTEQDVDNKYDDFLDDHDKDVIFDNYEVSTMMKKVDPDRYDAGLNEWRQKYHGCKECLNLFDDSDDLVDGLCEDCHEEWKEINNSK